MTDIDVDETSIVALEQLVETPDNIKETRRIYATTVKCLP